MCPSGVYVNQITASSNALNKPLKGCDSLLRKMVGLDQGARSRDPHRTNNSCYIG